MATLSADAEAAIFELSKSDQYEEKSQEAMLVLEAELAAAPDVGVRREFLQLLVTRAVDRGVRFALGS